MSCSSFAFLLITSLLLTYLHFSICPYCFFNTPQTMYDFFTFSRLSPKDLWKKHPLTTSINTSGIGHLPLRWRSMLFFSQRKSVYSTAPWSVNSLGVHHLLPQTSAQQQGQDLMRNITPRSASLQKNVMKHNFGWNTC